MTLNFLHQINKIVNNSNIQFRDYQARIIDKALTKFLKENTKSIMIESPCGAGKTIMALAIIKILQEISPTKVAWVAMRHNLLKQVVQENAFRKINADIIPVSMFDKNPPKADMIIIDESQHDSVKSMAHIYNTCQPRMILGMTATPYRSDRVKLCFNTVIKDAGIGKLIHDGYLSPYEHYTIPLWNIENVCKFYLQDINRWGKSIFYFHKVVDCYAALDVFSRNGVAAEVVTASTDKERQIEDFINDEYDVLLNCMILTEGFNCPHLKSVFCRPASKGPTIQMCGRAFRLCETLPVKNVIQCKRTKWPFLKTALPVNQYIWQENEWRSLKPNPEIQTAQRAVINAIRQISIELPKFITDKRTGQRPVPRNRPRAITL